MNGAASRTLKKQPAWSEFAGVDVFRDQSSDLGRNGDGPPAARPLGFGKPPNPLGSFERPRDRKRRPVPIEVFGAKRQILAGPKARRQSHQKNESRRILPAERSKALRFLWRKDTELAFVGAGQRHVGGRILDQ
jgi:hypothetical protein